MNVNYPRIILIYLKATPSQVLKDYVNKTPHIVKPITERTRSNIQKRLEKFNNALFQEGDYVRVKLSSYQSKVRKELKAKNSKRIIVYYSPEIFRIGKKIVQRKDKLCLPKYSLLDLDGREIKTLKGNKKKFNQNDLIKVDQKSETQITDTDVNGLNRLQNSDYLYREGDYEVRRDAEQEAIREKEQRRLERLNKPKASRLKLLLGSPPGFYTEGAYPVRCFLVASFKCVRIE